MGLIGISLIVASFVCFCMYPSAWLGFARPLLPWLQQPPQGTETDASAKEETRDTSADDDKEPAAVVLPDRAGQVPKPAPAPVPALIPAPVGDRPAPPPHPDGPEDDDDDEATTPKATPTPGNGADVPVFSLSVPGEDGGGDSDSDSDDHLPPPMFPSPFSAQRASGPAVPSAAPVSSAAPSLFSRSMPPPPPPSSSSPSSASLSPAPRTSAMAPPPQPGPRRPPTLNPVRGASATSGSSLRPAGLTPVPNRGGPAPSRLAPSSGSAGLAPRLSSSPSALPARGRNKISLAPGHSPLDWAHLCADPTANLRNLPPDAPQLLRVKPSLLKTMNGRRGRDAWTALGGMVYNITPYVPFHPGGAGELLRCAGKDGTRLFQDVHAWVNYDNMLAACRIGILVDESHASSVAGPMEEMD